MPRLSRKQKRTQRQEGIIDGEGRLNRSMFAINENIQPMTLAQQEAFDCWRRGSNMMLHGVAGTGKTFLALYFALRDVYDRRTPYEKVYIVRSTVATRNQGFLPGSQKQKEAVYEEVYPPICTDIFGRGDAYGILKQKDIVEFKSTSFLRGTTFNNCIIIVDEMQNCSFQECDTVMTRVGQNCKVFFAGDIRQDDLTSKRFNEESGLKDFIKIIKKMPEVSFVEFFEDDIIRSDLVKSYIIAKNRTELQL